MTLTIRQHLTAALNPGLLHEDELIEFMTGHIEFALRALDEAPHVVTNATTHRNLRAVLDPAPPTENT